jgi:CheY-like chemotaxis protein
MPIAQTCLPGETILVADNDAIARIAIAGYRGGCGVRVVEAAGGAEAGTVPKHGPAIRVLMIEPRLGNGSGFALAQWAQRHSPGVNAIIIAGLDRKSEPEIRDCGATLPGWPNACPAAVAPSRTH